MRPVKRAKKGIFPFKNPFSPLYVSLFLGLSFLSSAGCLSAASVPQERPIDNLRPLFEPIEATHIPAYMAPVKPVPHRDKPPLPYTGLHKGPDTILMCLDSGLGCFKPANVEEWQTLYLDSNGDVSVWQSPWGRNYLIPKGFNHREDWVTQWQIASDNCDFDGRCDFPAFVLKNRKMHKDLLKRLKTRSLGALYQPFFQPKFLRLKSKGDLQFQCDRITFVCTPFVNSETKVAGIYRPFLPFTYVTPLPIPPKEIQKQKAKKPKEDLHANTGYLGSEAE